MGRRAYADGAADVEAGDIPKRESENRGDAERDRARRGASE